ncbi:Rha family transcriptional regulator [Arcobacter cloacae]|uniref:Phage regulatory protein, Rha family n=1 Tax=Arcobacter cloacae TaxID=1054034 RepID=A0AA94JVG5_9BACT|nr:Rha family transcriptional regulator [Arcobacter cloacae]RXI41298.1 hypothetical protein CP963_07855 [Arcobacter cloacae]
MNKLVVKHKVKGEDVPVTTSLRVAEIFDKRHDNVVRDIEKLIDDMKPDTSDLRSQMFTLSTYKNRGKDLTIIGEQTQLKSSLKPLNTNLV